MSDPAMTRFRVHRYKQGDAAARYDAFDVPVGPRTTVLDALVWVRRTQDPSLTLRHSCFHASCGTCGMRINGREALACVTNVRALGGDEVLVEPLANAPLVSDLAVEMTGLYAQFEAVGRPLTRESELVPGARPPEGVAAEMRFEDCIECGLCMSACPIVATDGRYVGPAPLAAAMRVVREPRGADSAPVLRLADDEHGVWRCHATFECSEACPSAVDPAGAIMGLRRRLIGRRVSALLSRADASAR